MNETRCFYCHDRIHLDGLGWVDESDGDCCSGDDDLNNENGVHTPVELAEPYVQPHVTYVQNAALVKARLEYLRGELRWARISYGELAELQSLAEYIDPSDTELLEAAGVPEFDDDDDDDDDLVTYEVSVRNTFAAKSPEDAVRQMIEWLVDNAPSTGYRVTDEAGFVGFYDGEDV